MEGAVTGALDAILKQGGMTGAFLVLVIVVVVVLWRAIASRQAAVDKCQADRIEDGKAVNAEIRDLIEEVMKGLGTASQHIALSAAALSAANNANEARIRALDALVQRQETVCTELRRLQDMVAGRTGS